jgi:glycosyl transferase family 9 (putative heptosyltransferase)
VRTASGATAVQIAESVKGRRRIIAHVGSAHTEAELGLLMERAGEFFATASWRGFFDRQGRLMVRPSALVNKHKRDQLFEVLDLDPIYDSMDPRMSLSPERIEVVTAFCRENCPPGGRRLYTLHLDTQDIKMWPTASWITVVRHLWRRWRAWPLIIGQPTGSSDAILREFPFARSMFSYPDIRDQACGISVAHAFLGVDSMFAHVADSLQVPSVVVFGPFDLRVWGPTSATSSAIQMKVPELLHELDPVEVIRGVDDVLGGVLA